MHQLNRKVSAVLVLFATLHAALADTQPNQSSLCCSYLMVVRGKKIKSGKQCRDGIIANKRELSFEQAICYLSFM